MASAVAAGPSTRAELRGRGGADAAEKGGEATESQPVKPDNVAVYLMCFSNFCGDITRITVTSYFFWIAVLYMIGAVVVITGFQYTVPRVGLEIACPMKGSVYMLTGLWFFQSLIYFFTCWVYSGLSAVREAEGGGAPGVPSTGDPELKIERLTTGLSILGVFVKTVPTWIRLLHMLNLFQIVVWIVDLFLLPECNAPGLRWIVAVAVVIWWGVVIVGIRAKRQIFVPPALYDPLRPGQGFLRAIRHLMRGFGP